MITTRIAIGICAFSLIGVGMVAAVVHVQPATSDLESAHVVTPQIGSMSSLQGGDPCPCKHACHATTFGKR